MKASRSYTSWRVNLSAPRELLFDLLTPDLESDPYRASTIGQFDGENGWIAPEGAHLKNATLDLLPPRRIVANYAGGGVATLDLTDDGRGGTDLRLTDIGQVAEDRTELVAGWVSMLLALKASVDFSIDLRDHDHRTFWTGAYVEH
jgi:hypothetical protein